MPHDSRLNLHWYHILIILPATSVITWLQKLCIFNIYQVIIAQFFSDSYICQLTRFVLLH